MTTKRHSIICFYIILIIFIAGCAETMRGKSGRLQDVPEIKKDCELCHLSGELKERSQLKESVTKLCVQCHSNKKGPTEHAVDVVPSMEVRDLPLSDGRITCATCHNPHENTYGKLLRTSIMNLCKSCHKY